MQKVLIFTSLGGNLISVEILCLLVLFTGRCKLVFNVWFMFLLVYLIFAFIKQKIREKRKICREQLMAKLIIPIEKY